LPQLFGRLPILEITIIIFPNLIPGETEPVMQDISHFFAHGQIDMVARDCAMEGPKESLEVVLGTQGVGYYYCGEIDEGLRPCIRNNTNSLQLHTGEEGRRGEEGRSPIKVICDHVSDHNVLKMVMGNGLGGYLPIGPGLFGRIVKGFFLLHVYLPHNDKGRN